MLSRIGGLRPGGSTAIRSPSTDEVAQGARYIGVWLLAIAVASSSLTFNWVLYHRPESNFFPEFAGAALYLSDLWLVLGLSVYVPVHSVPVLILAELGVIGGLAWIVVVVSPLIWLLSRRFSRHFRFHPLLWLGPIMVVLPETCWTLHRGPHRMAESYYGACWVCGQGQALEAQSTDQLP